jgi:hypothetical protein
MQKLLFLESLSKPSEPFDKGRTVKTVAADSILVGAVLALA